MILATHRTPVVLNAINELSHEQFEWGVSDCCCLAAIVATALTGKNVLKGFHYRSRDEAAAILRSSGGLRGVVSTLLGQQPKFTLDGIQDGDPVLLNLPPGLGFGETLGVALTDRVVMKSQHGLSWAELGSDYEVCSWRL